MHMLRSISSDSFLEYETESPETDAKTVVLIVREHDMRYMRIWAL